MDEVRPGYMTIDLICDMLEDHIKLNIKDHKYVGDNKYLSIYNQYKEYLKKNE